MLFLTDRHDAHCGLWRELQLVRPCVLQPLHHELTSNRTFRVIVSDVCLDNPVAVGLLKGTLSPHKAKNLPLLCLVRGDIHHTTLQARALGASAVLPYNSDRNTVLDAVSKLVSEFDPESARTRPVRDGVVSAGKAIAEIFDAARASKPISTCVITHGSNAVLDAIRDTSVRAWIDLVWQLDDITYQHCLLVSGLAAAFAIQLKFSADDRRLFTQAALVHDLGKSRIPLSILNKPGKLSPSELDVIRAHPGIGFEILIEQSGFSDQVLEVVKHHHEFLDGTGYPDRLQGAAIPDLVRLATICDIFAALIERRSYKPPLHAAAAFSVLESMGGKLDHDLLRAFRPIVDDIGAYLQNTCEEGEDRSPERKVESVSTSARTD